MNMYVPKEEQQGIAEHLVGLFMEKNMVSFSKQCADLYERYGEFTADDIMLKVRKAILTKGKQLMNQAE